MDILQLYQDYSIDHKEEGHKHCRPGWSNVECPFCTTDNPGYHLGYHLQNDFYTCWKCGWHGTSITISKLLKVSEQEARQIIKKYGLLIPRRTKEIPIHIRAKAHHFPTGVIPLQAKHKKYLEDRNFDPDELEREWNLVGTGPLALLDDLNYKHRIMIPFVWNGQQVSFDSRDITYQHPFKYMACPLDREVIPHKEILYGNQNKWKDTGIGVEGPTDVWRLGPLSCAVSGIKFTPKQVRLIANTFKRFAVCFDGGEAQALIQANALVSELRFRGVDAFRIDITGDPGDMSQDDANHLVRSIVK